MIEKKTQKYSSRNYLNDPVTSLHPRLIIQAYRQALLSPGVTNGMMRVGAVLFKGRRVLAAACNSYKSNAILARYSKWPFRHAESSILIQYGLDRVEGKSILVIRINKANKLTMARPCNVCLALMRDYYIDEIYYSDWEGEIRCLK